jgi:hypothetical protein
MRLPKRERRRPAGPWVDGPGASRWRPSRRRRHRGRRRWRRPSTRILWPRRKGPRRGRYGRGEHPVTSDPSIRQPYLLASEDVAAASSEAVLLGPWGASRQAAASEASLPEEAWGGHPPAASVLGGPGVEASAEDRPSRPADASTAACLPEDPSEEVILRLEASGPGSPVGAPTEDGSPCRGPSRPSDGHLWGLETLLPNGHDRRQSDRRSPPALHRSRRLRIFHRTLGPPSIA